MKGDSSTAVRVAFGADKDRLLMIPGFERTYLGAGATSAFADAGVAVDSIGVEPCKSHVKE